MAKRDEDNQSAHYSKYFDRASVKENIQKKSSLGRRNTFISQGVSYVFQFISTIVLARLIVPEQFGVVAMVLAVTRFVDLFKELGLSQVTIQSENISHEQVSTLFWINSGIGICFTLLNVGIAPCIAWFYNDPRLTVVACVISVSFLLSGFAVQHTALLRRQMEFGKIASVTIISKILSTAGAILLALNKAGYWAVVFQLVSGYFFSCIGTWMVCVWRPTLRIQTAGIFKLIKFGLEITIFNIVTYLSLNLDKVLLGKFWGPSVVGLYDRAYQLVSAPISQLRLPLFFVSMPGLSLLQSDPYTYKKHFLEFVKSTALTLMPLAVFCALFAKEIVLICLGSQWIAATQIFQIMAITQIVRPVLSTLDQVPLSLGKSKNYLKVGFANAIVSISGIICGLSWGGKGVAIGYLCATILLIIPFSWICLKGTTISTFDFLKSNTVAIFFSSPLCIVALCLRSSHWIQNSMVILGCGSLALCIIYCTILIHCKHVKHASLKH